MRDYGTGAWAGGDPDCDHARQSAPSRASSGLEGATVTQGGVYAWGDVCGKCGATRQDQQLGLEPDPATYVANMVAVFREVRRVMAPHATAWINLGDSYATTAPGTVVDAAKMTGKHVNRDAYRRAETPAGLKPKDLVGIPWRIAFALQNDGWYLRADIIWAKPNPLPESVRDRPTKAHEYVFLLSKQPRYWFDAEAVREPATYAGKIVTLGEKSLSKGQANGANVPKSGNALKDAVVVAAGRNIRSVWEIATQPYSEAHFATFPEELVRRALLAGCPEWVCVTCRKPRERIVEKDYLSEPTYKDAGLETTLTAGRNRNVTRMGNGVNVTTLGFTDCGHGDYRPGVVLDPFLGSGTTALVARRHGRHCVGIELNPDYAALAARRTQQLSMLTELLA